MDARYSAILHEGVAALFLLLPTLSMQFQSLIDQTVQHQTWNRSTRIRKEPQKNPKTRCVALVIFAETSTGHSHVFAVSTELVRQDLIKP